MKKGFYILLLLGLMPGFVLAKDAEASFKLECNPTSRRGGEVSCSLKASLTQPDNTQEGTTPGEGEGGEVVTPKEVKLNEVSASVTVDEANVFATGNTINKTNLLLTGDNKEVAKFNLQVKDNAKVGDTKIEVKIISAKDEDGNLITVTSQDLTNNVKILNNNTTLKSLQIDDKTSSCNLSQTSCTLDSVKGKTIKIGATPDDKNASVSGTGTKNLSCGNNKFTVTVTAEDKTAKKDFTINVRKSIFNSIYNFTRRIPIKYQTIIVDKKYIDNCSVLRKKLLLQINDMIRKINNYLKKFDVIVMYYDNGQEILGKILDQIFCKYNGFEHRELFDHKEKRLFQVSDMLTFIDKYNYKYKNKMKFTKGEKYFFTDEEIRLILREIDKKRL